MGLMAARDRLQPLCKDYVIVGFIALIMCFDLKYFFHISDIYSENIACHHFLPF